MRCIAQILQDEIDILVDLAGHTAGNRLALFGAKPLVSDLSRVLRHYRTHPGGLLGNRQRVTSA